MQEGSWVWPEDRGSEAAEGGQAQQIWKNAVGTGEPQKALEQAVAT